LEKILVGMSGGVDSSVCALALADNGYAVSGVTLTLLGESDDTNVKDAKSVCDRLGIEHYSLDLSEDFKHFVIDNFIDEYLKGNTPNPCIVCNKYIKFGKMLEKAKEMGFSKIATGHYARIKEQDGRYLLLKAADTSKDQSYVLYCLSQEQLSSVEFPLGELSKPKVREMATHNGFVNANKKDSQDICFVPDGDYASFIEKTANFVSSTGDYINSKGEKIGEHKGVIHYTIGQRKGLGVAFGHPVFVISKNAETNQVVLGEQEDLFYKSVIIKDVNFIPFDELKSEMEVGAKLRYSQKEQPAIIKPLENNQVLIEFFEPQRAPSAGQAAVFYNGDVVVGGGTIVKGIE
jgi:tRNA-specific 2-thiouridylase